MSESATVDRFFVDSFSWEDIVDENLCAGGLTTGSPRTELN